MTAYDEVGGQAVVKTAVSIFYNRVTDDESLARWFDGVDLNRLRAHQRAFLTAALDGPEIFMGRKLDVAHAGMEITDEAFTSIIGHLAVTLSDLDVDDEVIEVVRVRLEALRTTIVQAPALT